jgi:hypothetical protein
MQELERALQGSVTESLEEYGKIVLDIDRNKLAFRPLNRFSASFTYNNKQWDRLHQLSDAGILEEIRDSSYLIYRLTDRGKVIAEKLKSD